MANGYPTTEEVIELLRQQQAQAGPLERAAWSAPIPRFESTPAVPAWLQGAADWLEQPGYARGMVTPGAGLVSYARDVAAGQRVSPLETVAAGLDVPVPGAGAASKALSGLGGVMGHTMYHGSPYLFRQFKAPRAVSKAGEGTAAFGHGLYFAEEPEVARSYMNAKLRADIAAGRVTEPEEMLSGFRHGEEQVYAHTPTQELTPREVAILRVGSERTREKAKASLMEEARMMEEFGVPELSQKYAKAAEEAEGLDIGQIAPIEPQLYTVDIPDEAIPRMLDWDKPLSRQPNDVTTAIQAQFPDYSPEMTGEEFYRALSQSMGSDVAASEALKEAGIPGLRFLDKESREAGAGTRNMVLFDELLASITERQAGL